MSLARSAFADAGQPFQGMPRKEPGQNMTFCCMGCGKAQPGAGSRGVGIRRRCLPCLQHRGAAQ